MKLIGKKNKVKTSKNKPAVYVNNYYDDDDFEEFGENELRAYREARMARIRKKKMRKKRIIILIASIAAAVFIFLNWNKIAPTALSENIQSFFSEFGKSKYPVEFEEGLAINAVPIGSNIGILTDTSFLIYSQNGDKLASRSHGLNNPAIVYGGGRALIYDRGGKQFKVETRFGEPLSATASYSITSAAMGDSGNFAIITEAENYLSELTVYSSANKALFKWDAAKGRILAAALSPDGKKLAAVVTGARKGEIFSDIYIFSLSSEKPLAVKQFSGILFYSIRFKDNKRIALVGDKKAVFLFDNGEIKSEYAYNENDVLCAANSDGPVVLALKKNSETSTLIALDGEGKRLGMVNVKGKITHLFFGSDYVVALTDGRLYKSKADLVKPAEISIPVGIETAVAVKKYVFIIGTQSIGRYNLK